MSGTYCPVCGNDSGSDAEEWFNLHENKPVHCDKCDAPLVAVYDGNPEGDMYWMYEPAHDHAGVTTDGEE
jgi:hypothetical protein